MQLQVSVIIEGRVDRKEGCGCGATGVGDGELAMGVGDGEGGNREGETGMGK